MQGDPVSHIELNIAWDDYSYHFRSGLVKLLRWSQWKQLTAVCIVAWTRRLTGYNAHMIELSFAYIIVEYFVEIK